MWTSLLDPRFGFGLSHWKESEKQPAKVLFIREVKKLAIAQINVQISVESSVSSEESCHDNEDDDEYGFNFHHPNAEERQRSCDLRLREERASMEAEQEVNMLPP